MTDTIAAAATPMLPSAIGILRISGPGAAAAAAAVFRPDRGGSLTDAPPRQLVTGRLLDREGRVLDRVMALWAPAPGTYTGEETAELHCHGSPAVLAEGLLALFRQGVRQAQPGEFTRRAFLNGRMDLMQAEAAADLLEAPTAACARRAASQLTGPGGRSLQTLSDELTELLAHFHAVVDYPDEDPDPFVPVEALPVLDAAVRRLEVLRRSFDRSRLLRQGLRTVVVGRPNAGKSSLMNALLGRDRVLTSPIPGTTRDVVEDTAVVGDLLLRLMDTAGLRDSGDPLEQAGVARSREAAAGADLLLAVVDGAAPLTEEDGEILALAEQAPKAVLVYTKSDLPGFALPEGREAVAVSSLTGQGLEDLTGRIEALFSGDPEPEGTELLLNARQEDAVRRAAESLSAAAVGIRAGVTPDAALSDVELALEALGELTGRSLRADVLDTIFSRFCVGK